MIVFSQWWIQGRNVGMEVVNFLGVYLIHWAPGDMPWEGVLDCELDLA